MYLDKISTILRNAGASIMETTKTLLIFVGNDKSKQNLFMESLVNEFGYERVDLCGTKTADFIPDLVMDEKTFLADYKSMVEPVEIEGSYYGVKVQSLVSGEANKKVVSVPSALAESLYSVAMQNSIAPVLINIEAESNDIGLGMSKKWAVKNAIDTSNLSTPISMTVTQSDSVEAKDLNMVANWTTNFLTSKIDFKELRKKSLGEGRASELLHSIDQDAKRKYKYQKMSALALGIGLSTAGSPEIAMALLGSFFMAKESIKSYNEKTSLFKENGFSLAQRLHYFAFGNPDDVTDEDKQIYNEQEKNIIYSLIDKVEKAFGDLHIAADKMASVESLYEKAKIDYFQPKEQIAKSPQHGQRVIR